MKAIGLRFSNEKASGAGIRASEFDPNTGRLRSAEKDHKELQTPAFAGTGASPPMPEYHGTIGTGP